jgi:hypothetical protein
MKGLECKVRQLSLTKKHYRKFFRDELENCPSIFPKPVFQNLDLTRGATRGVGTSIFSKQQFDSSG